MNDQHISATQMVWQPELIRLTSSAHPDVNGGKATFCYINPQYITLIERKAIQHHKLSDDSKYPQQEATAVIVNNSLGLYVEETPEQVAFLRDKAMGHAPKIGSV